MKDEGYIDSSFGIETHYPNEVNLENMELYFDFEKETGIRLITVIPDLFYDAAYEFDPFPTPTRRSENMQSSASRSHCF